MAKKQKASIEKSVVATPIEHTSTIETPAVSTPEPRRHRFDIWSVFLGVMLVAVGGLILLSNLGALNVDWSNVWRLWPLFIVAAGFSVLASTHWLWRLLSVVTVVAALGGLIWFTTGHNIGPEGDVQNQQITVLPADKITQARVEIEAGASKIDIGSHTGNTIVDAKLASNGQTIDKQETTSGDTQTVRLSSATGRTMWHHMTGKSTWTISLTERLPVALAIHTGASQVVADVSKTKLKSLEVNAGASSLDIKLGASEPKQTVSIDSGASSITLRLPQNNGVSLKVDGGLNTKNLADLKAISDNTYRSDNYADAAQTINITADIGVATLTIVRY